MADSRSAPWLGHAAGRWGHWGASWLIVCISVIIAIGLWPVERGTSLVVLAPIAVLAFAVCTWLAMRQHDRGLCEVCVLAMPLNAAEVASRYRRRFAVAHAGANRGLVAAYVVVLFGSNLALHAGTPARVCWALVQSSMIYLVLAYSTHRRLQPWCPGCQSGNGDDDRAEVSDPMPQGGRSR